MISSAEEFKKLRTSKSVEEQRLSTLESADIKVWYDVIQKFPDLKEWVIHNKTIQIEILEYLATDEDQKIRYAIAKKRKINKKIFDLLKTDSDETVRHALISNNGLTMELKQEIKVEDSEWLRSQLVEKIFNDNKVGNKK